MSGWYSTYQPYVESATAHSDVNITRNDGFWRAPEIDFCAVNNARNVMVDFKF